MKKIVSIVVCLYIGLFSFAQNGTSTNMMRENGKIYVVAAVMLTILAGLILYLVRLDRKISKLEKNK